MKKESVNKKYIVAFVLAFLTFGLTADFSAQTSTPTPRTRVIVSAPKTTPTPTPKPKISPTPKFTPTPTPQPTPVAKQTVQYLQTKIAMALANPLLKRGQVGVKIISLDSGQTVYERNADNYFMPASNMKSYTVAAALDKLGPNFRFVTSVYALNKPDANGVLNGDLIIYGRGDPSISTAFYDSDYYGGLDALADKIMQSGVKEITGSLIGDETYFKTEPIPNGWEWDDLQWYYGAELSSLTINDNAVDLKILPTTLGNPLTVQILPNNRQFKIINTSQTSARGTKREIRVTKLLGQNVLEVSGNMPENDSGYTGSITISRPAELFVELLKQRLQLKGVNVRGTTRAINLQQRRGIKLPVENYTEIAKFESQPLSIIAAKTMKPSQNLYTELILRALGEAAGNTANSSNKTSEQKGMDIVQELLQKAGVPADSIVHYDASGLSRHNLITPNSSAMLFKYMDKSPNSAVWQNVLTIGGVDGTLKRRFVGTSGENNIRGKTGTIDQVSALSGYVTSKSGERFAFSVLTNFIPNTSLRTSTIDEIVLLLANFDGKTGSSN